MVKSYQHNISFTYGTRKFARVLGIYTCMGVNIYTDFFQKHNKNGLRSRRQNSSSNSYEPVDASSYSTSDRGPRPDVEVFYFYNFFVTLQLFFTTFFVTL